MSTVQDVIDLTASSPVYPLPAPLTWRSPSRHRTTSPVNQDPSSNDVDECQRRKRSRLEAASDVEYVTAATGSDADQPQSQTQEPPPTDTSQSSISLPQISTWEIPPDVVSDNKPHPTGEASPKAPPSPPPSDQPVAILSNLSTPINLSDSDDPVIVSPKADQVFSGAPSSSKAIATSTKPTPEPLSTYTCPICFSPPTNATLTPCGHVCCGQCLFTAVKSTIRRNMVVAMDRAPPARCPVCRAEIPGWDGRGGGVVGLKMQVLFSL
ncbi:hypothetical protein V8E55_004080 [Tylopilus felleus]